LLILLDSCSCSSFWVYNKVSAQYYGGFLILAIQHFSMVSRALWTRYPIWRVYLDEWNGIPAPPRSYLAVFHINGCDVLRRYSLNEQLNISGASLQPMHCITRRLSCSSEHNPVPRTASNHPPKLSYLIKRQQIQS